MPMPNKLGSAYLYITRHQDARWRVWVQFDEIDSGSVYFSDVQYGSSDLALEVAVAYRDKFAAEHNIPLRVYDGNGYCIRDSRSKSGLVGVSLRRNPRKNPKSVCWSAQIWRNGKASYKSFALRVYGYSAAYLEAARIRVAITGQTIPHVPAPPLWLVAWAESHGVNLD